MARAAVLKEMASLFTDEVLNIGCDETAVKGPCSLESTFGLERQLLRAIADEFGKQPAGWEEVYFDAKASCEPSSTPPPLLRTSVLTCSRWCASLQLCAKAATPGTLVDAWTRHTAAEVIATGHAAIESKSSAFYFTAGALRHPTPTPAPAESAPTRPIGLLLTLPWPQPRTAAPGGPEGWAKCWYDIGAGVNATGRSAPHCPRGDPSQPRTGSAKCSPPPRLRLTRPVASCTAAQSCCSAGK